MLAVSTVGCFNSVAIALCIYGLLMVLLFDLCVVGVDFVYAG